MVISEKNVPLWEKTTFRIGGLADTLLYPESAEELAELMKKKQDFFILGGGSNILVADKGIRGTTISLARGFAELKIEKQEDGSIKIFSGAGTSLTQTSSTMMKNSIAGLEFAYGIPGTVGGALIMNAGALGGEMQDVVESVTFVTLAGEIKTLNKKECGFSYRSSAFPKGCVIAGAVLQLKAGDKKKIHEKMKQNYMNRKSKQPLELPSAGSIFKNPEGDFAGRLIEAAGLKGSTHGGAKISEKHANFIVNRGGAKATDVICLIEKIEETVNKKFGITLRREIKLAGAF